MALSWQCRPGVFLKQLEKRQRFLDAERETKRTILRAVSKEVGHPHHEAVWMLNLAIDQMGCELRWLEKVMREAPSRAPARHPAESAN
jgi:hypothetical protein